MNLTSKAVTKPHKVLLPVVERMIHQLDSVFVDCAGPVGQGLAEDTYRQWLLAGKTGPSGLRQYVSSLGSQLEPERRREFSLRAEQMLDHLGSGFVN